MLAIADIVHIFTLLFGRHIEDDGSKDVIAGSGREDKLSLSKKWSQGMQLRQPLTAKSSSRPSQGGIVFTDRRRG